LIGWAKGLSLATKLIIVVVLIWVAVFVYELMTAGDKTRARLGENQADAAIESGADAVGAVGRQADSDRGLDAKVQETGNAIDRAEDGAGVDAAGRDGLCDIAGLCPEE